MGVAELDGSGTHNLLSERHRAQRLRVHGSTNILWKCTLCRFATPQKRQHGLVEDEVFEDGR
jgi:hypothetical protein